MTRPALGAAGVVHVVMKFSLTTGATRAHNPRCPHSYDQKGFTVTIITGASVEHCVEKFVRDEHLTARGYPKPVVCDCLTGKVEP